MSKRLDVVGLAAVVLTAAYFTIGVVWVRSANPANFPANDIYAWVYPSAVYAWRAIRAGSGLLWNPYQDCGQPFFAISQTGLLYPVNWLFAVLDREPALLTSLIINLSIAGAGAYLLGRAIGLGMPAALCGALAFQLGGSAVQLAGWTPIHIASYAWLAVAMWRTERLVAHPTVRGGIVLGLALTLQLLPGFPQISFFTYQLIALRLAWSLVTAEARRPRALLGCAAIGVLLPPFLAAVQLLPAIEVTRESVRALPLSSSEIGAGFSWTLLLATLRASVSYPGSALAIPLAGLALLAGRRAPGFRHALFYATVAALYFVLSLGPGTPLFGLYARLPLGTTFRGAARLFWVVSFAMAMLVGLGAEELLRRIGPAGGSRSRIVALLLVGVVALNYAALGLPPLFNLRRGDLYGAAGPAFDFVRARLTPQDRVFLVGRYGVHPDFALAQKAAMLARVPTIFDYEPLASRSYAEFFTYMRTGRPLQQLGDWYWVFDKLMLPTLQRPLLDLTAARYLLIDRALDRTPRLLTPAVHLLTEADYVRIYENAEAMPRARYVPGIAVLPAEQILPRLAAADPDPRRVALVSAAPRSGFLGSDASASGSVAIALDAAERVVIQVHASAPGFLFLADQYFPGWTARVNGARQEILRADHTFRLVEVPAGDSEVVFTYQPTSVRVGALISFATIAVLVLVWMRSRDSGLVSGLSSDPNLETSREIRETRPEIGIPSR